MQHIKRNLAILVQLRHVLSMDLTPAQCRAARGLIGITQDDLAAASGVSKRTIASFETSERQAISANIAAIRTALEAAGVEFIPENGGGAGVRLRRE